jgi:peroxiredoxin family protein/TusA-related sulfurtransferase/rhodanese-related sulfurtransferase
VSIIEMLDQVMAPLDYEMAQMVHENIIANNTNLILSDGVDHFEDDGNKVKITLKSGKEIKVDLVILSIGVKPNSELAKDAGLETNPRGGVITNEYLLTSDPSIYAVGDVIEVDDLILDRKTMIPLAGPANKQGRIAADNIAGGKETYDGTQGTSIAQVFDLNCASTGLNEKTLTAQGLTKGEDYETVTISQNSHAGYYPGAVPLILKLIFSVDGNKLYGAQIVGGEGVDKRIDTIATTIRLGGGVTELTKLELAYAPPFSSAKDPVNMAGFTAENVITGKVHFSDWDALEKNKDAIILDVREEAELMAFALPNAINIPLGMLRERLDELDRSKTIIPFCAIGVRSYNAARILMNNGFEHVDLYPAGTGFYRSTHHQDYMLDIPDGFRESASPGNMVASAGTDTATTSVKPEENCKVTTSITLDCSGLQCPGPIMKVFETIQKMDDGDIMEITASDPGFMRDIGAWCRRTGNTLISSGKKNNSYVATVQKGIGDQNLDKGKTSQSLQFGEAPLNISDKDIKTYDDNEGKTIIVFSGDLDKVLASFIIANGAAAMGRPVTMFFTFWGLIALRKEEKQPVKKSFMESMFGAMLPRGSKKLKLSKMNMAGMGTKMMKKIMNDKNVDSLEALMQKAMGQGVKIVACTMSMDVMGIKEEELIQGVELGGVGAYLGDAEESSVNLFI